MIHRKRIRALARSSVAVFITAALGACSASTHPGPTGQIPNASTRQSEPADSGAILPEITVSAGRLRSPRVAEELSSRPPAKRGG